MNDKEYQAQDDAYTLARAQEIKDNPDRQRRANAALDTLAEDKAAEAAAARRAKSGAKGTEKARQRGSSNPAPNIPEPQAQPRPGTKSKLVNGFFTDQWG